jgi:hypothetical protein
LIEPVKALYVPKFQAKMLLLTPYRAAPDVKLVAVFLVTLILKHDHFALRTKCLNSECQVPGGRDGPHDPILPRLEVRAEGCVRSPPDPSDRAKHTD